MLDEKSVCVYQADKASYPDHGPFHPDTAYPEYRGVSLAGERNFAYSAVRECLRLLDRDPENFGTLEWNPLKGLIHPGETVLLKPNFVKEYHPRDAEGWKYVLTHGSVVRAIADYVWIALEGRGRLILADAPQTDSSFSKIRGVLQLDSIVEHYASHGLNFEVIDMRKEEHVATGGAITERYKLAGDPNGYIAYNLASNSEFADHDGGGRYYGADYDEGEVNRHHTGGRHEYMISGTAMIPDVVLSIPKLKTHKKAGITVSLKNLVGINGEKNWLPHHTEAGPGVAGDERPLVKNRKPLERIIIKPFKWINLMFPKAGGWLHRNARGVGKRFFGDTEEVVRSGNWYGNDTIWRTCLDLNKLLVYGNQDGSLRVGTPENRKRHFALVDGIIAGEGRGPMNPDPLPTGCVLFGTNCPSVDAACATIMGFDASRIPIVRNAFRCKGYSLAEWDWVNVRIVSNNSDWNAILPQIPAASTFHFRPHFGWVGHIERKEDSAPQLVNA